MGHPVLFFIVAAIAVIAAIRLVQAKNAIYGALWLILNLCAIAVFYLILNAPFIAMVQIAVYAGAIMVLFLFVIMLLGAERIHGESIPQGWQPWIALLLGGVLVAALFVALLNGDMAATAAPVFDASPEAIGIALFEGFVFPFEVTSLLLLAAMIGVVVLKTTKKKES